jgi:hypothetical protein
MATPGAPATADPAELQKNRNLAEARDIQKLRDTKTTQDLTAHLLTLRLRYVFPEYPTDLENLFIPAFRVAFPELEADLTKYQANASGCSCAGRIGAALVSSAEKTQATLDTIFGGRLFKFIATPGAQSRQGLIGTTAIIEASPQAWQAYFDVLIKTKGHGAVTTLKTLYNGVSVQPADDGKKWILLFY